MKETLTEHFWTKTYSAYENGDTLTANRNIDLAANLLTNVTRDLVGRATKSTRKPRKMHTMIDDAANLVEQNVKDQQKMKSFYDFVRNIKNGLDHDNEELPDLSAFKTKLETKLHALNTPNTQITEQTIREIYEPYPTALELKTTFQPTALMRYNCCAYYMPNPNIHEHTHQPTTAPDNAAIPVQQQTDQQMPTSAQPPDVPNIFLDDDDAPRFQQTTTPNRPRETRTEKKAPQIGDPDTNPNLAFPDKREFLSTILSVNKSGACDVEGISTKATSTIIRQSEPFRGHIFRLFRAICYIGHIPERFKTDKIVFLYKRKGDLLDPANYRPITHAPAYGKHLEKILLKTSKSIDDQNRDNHAYTQNHSIFSAIANLIATTEDINKLNDTLLTRPERRNHKILPIIIAEDISGAFESLHHESIASCISHMHQLHHYPVHERKKIQIKLDLLVQSYLTRKSRVSNDKEQLELHNRAGRSTPQGSSISPKFWRIHDQLFSRIYQNRINATIGALGQHVIYHKHIAYADDHITVLAVKIPTAAIDNKQKTHVFLENVAKLEKTIHFFRSHLAKATELVGSKINPAKTEIIVQAPYNDHVTLAKQEFKWLGYTLKLNTSGKLIVTDTQITKKTVSLSILLEDIYKYIPSLKTRIRIYKVWAAPVIEFFLLQQILDNTQRSKLESVQHKCICEALRLIPDGTPKQDVIEAVNEISIDRKCQRFAAGLSNTPTVKALIADDLETAEIYHTTKSTRSGTVTANTLYNELNTLTIALNTLSHEWTEFADDFKAQKKVKIDFETLPNTIKELKRKRKQRIAEKTQDRPVVRA